MSEETKDLKITIPSDKRHLSSIRSFTEEALTRKRVPGHETTKIVMAVDEAVSNVIEHGYGSKKKGTVEVEIKVSDAIVVCVRDRAPFFNPSRIRRPNLARHLKSGKGRGLGLFLIRRIMDRIRYRKRSDRRNELVMTRRVQGP